MWKEGKKLLSTHGDAIFYHSMWNVSRNGYYILTIVVQDRNRKIRLTAASLTKAEKKVSWTSFFDWIKQIVPSFNPKCIVTDGATYIESSFSSVLGPGARHIVCWWHQRQNVMKKIGICKRKMARWFLKIAYASTALEKQILPELPIKKRFRCFLYMTQ